MNPSTNRAVIRSYSCRHSRVKYTAINHGWAANVGAPKWQHQDLQPGRPYIRLISTSTTASAKTDVLIPNVEASVGASRSKRGALPIVCPGCGALSQNESRNEAGYYSSTRKAVQDYITEQSITRIDATPAATGFGDAAHNDLKAKRIASLQAESLHNVSAKQPYCDRCHNLTHHNQGIPIAHPALADLEATIVESSHDRNHVWHVIDAADFPMSLIRDLDKRLSSAYLRSRNRRSKDSKYVAGKQAHMSFIITRADLLATKKEFVDQMVPKLKDILRVALQTRGEQPRLGNVHVVSANRGWWTKSIKESLLEDQGAHWLVGKVNVGKSKLFESVFPKHTNKRTASVQSFDRTVPNSVTQSSAHVDTAVNKLKSSTTPKDELHNTFNLLSPRQQIMQYPIMPIISSMPGTTASPIRVPFRDGKCELIDLPGLRRGSMEDFVRPERRGELVMTERVVPKRIVIKPGQSLLLGGLIRMTPSAESPVIMAHCFTPLSTHLTSNMKADAFCSGDLQFTNVDSIASTDARAAIQSAGSFRLEDDVTRLYAGPLTRKDAIGLRPERLPFAVLATDILVEGVGWIELQAQVRKPKSLEFQRQLLPASNASQDIEQWTRIDRQMRSESFVPEVEIFSPQGNFIGQRMSLCAFARAGPRAQKKGARPRQSMVSVKHRQKSKSKIPAT